MNRGEIGGEFWDGPPAGPDVFEPDQGMACRYTLSGRTAMEQIALDAIRELGALTVYMPSYCCHTMLEPLRSAGAEVRFYTVRYDGQRLVREYDPGHGCNAVLLMDYFGFLASETAALAKLESERGNTVIADLTHSAFCQGDVARTYADYVCISIRKWFFTVTGLAYKRGSFVTMEPTGTNERYVAMRKEAARKKRAYMQGSRDDGPQIQACFEEAESLLEQTYAGYAADRESVKQLGGINQAQVRRSHRGNARVLLEGLHELPEHVIRPIYAEMGPGDCPLYVPVWIGGNRRDALRNYLLIQGIRCSAHWTVSGLHSCEPADREIYAHELSLVCDHRYTAEDMRRILSVIKKFAEDI